MTQSTRIFGITNLDSMFQVELGRTIALIGEEGTMKSRLGRAFLAQGLDEGGHAVLVTFGHIIDLDQKLLSHWDVLAKQKKSEEEFRAHVSRGLIHRRLSAQGLSAERFVHIVFTNLLESCRKYLENDIASEEDLDRYFEKVKSEVDLSRAAKSKKDHLMDWLLESFPNRPVPWAEHIRVVLDDLSQFRAIFPDIDANKSLLGYLVDALRYAGFTSMIIDTQPGSPFQIARTDTDRELRSYVDYGLYTWTLRLGGESRVAITAVPPVSELRHSYIRELKAKSDRAKDTKAKGKPEALEVSRHLELYSFNDEGEPRITPMRAILFDETGPANGYLEEVDNVLKHATGHSFNLESTLVQFKKDEWLRDMLNIRPRIILSSETVLVQIDNWWVAANDEEKDISKQLLSMPDIYHRWTKQHDKAIIRANAQTDKEAKPSSTELDREVLAGPMFSKQPSEIDAKHMKLVPYYWSFGFLMLRQQAWYRGRVSDLLAVKLEHGLYRGRHRQVRGLAALITIASNLKKANHDPITSPVRGRPPRYSVGAQIPWSDFFAACVALHEMEATRRKEGGDAPAFVLACASGESLNCLVLEIWASIYADLHVVDVDSAEVLDRAKEIVDQTLHRKKTGEKGEDQIDEEEDDGKIDKAAYSKLLRDLEDAYFEVLKKEQSAPFRLTDGSLSTEGDSRPCLLENLEGNELFDVLHKDGLACCALYLALLHLVEVLDVQKLASYLQPFDLTAGFDGMGEALSGRHWYSTAVSVNEEFESSDPLVPFMLPGRYSTRGDWYLGALQESRSEYMAELAAYALTSRRGAIDRMKRGIGLPFYKLSQADGERRGNRTAIPRSVEGRVGYVYYSDLKQIAPLHEEAGHTFNEKLKPIWRCSIKNYSRHARIFRRWTVRALVDLAQVKEARHQDWIYAGDVMDAIKKSTLAGDQPWDKAVVVEARPADQNEAEWLKRPILVEQFDSYRIWFKPLLEVLFDDLEEAKSRPDLEGDPTD